MVQSYVEETALKNKMHILYLKCKWGFDYFN